MERRTLIPVFLCLLALTRSGVQAGRAASASGEDLAAAQALFQANLDAIRHRDRVAYLACYLESERLARTDAEGFELGYQGLASAAGDAWPDVFEAADLRLVWVRPGLVYGTYRYRVAYGADEQSGLSERLFVETPGGWRIAVTSAFPALPGVPPPPRALVGATLIDGTGRAPVVDAAVVLRDGRIECAGSREACPVPEGIDVTDLGGRWVVPGLIDAHVHFSQTGWADGRPDALDVREAHPYERVQAALRAHPERFFRSYLCSGVTAVYDVGGYPWTWELRERAERDTRAPHVAASGPLLSTWDFWLNLPGERQFIYLSDEAAARAGVRYLASHGADAAKVWFIPVQERAFEEMAKVVSVAGEEARALGLPLIVHATGLQEAKAALQAGASLLVHGVWDAPVDQEFLDLALRNRTIYCPTLTVSGGYQRMSEAVLSSQPPAVHDPNRCLDRETLARIGETATLGAHRVDAARVAARNARQVERDRLAASNLRRVRDAGVPIAMGTDAGNPLTVHGPSVYAEMEAMQAAGLSPMEVLVASTSGAARAMRREAELGALQAGKAADLLVLTADPTVDIANLRQIESVVRGGVMRRLEELREVEPANAPQR